MKIASITIQNFRSIRQARKIQLKQLTTLVGRNNEGKSNIVRAFVAATQILVETYARPRFARPDIPARLTTRHYSWRSDFPIGLQAKQPEGQSVFELEFELSDAEVGQFQTEIGSTLNGTLPIRLTLGDRSMKIEVAKQGPGGKALTAKSDKIARFISNRIEVAHVPAVRTASSSVRIVNQLVERELETPELEAEYTKALKRLESLQRPILDRLSVNIKETLVSFLPDIKDVRIEVRSNERYEALRRSCEIIVDDGTATLLQVKGDGVQSLAALGLMRHVTEAALGDKALIIAIEEPESHLHSEAIHDLHGVIRELSQRHQIILTTHNPLFVDRMNVGSNILVGDQRAQPARTVDEIRTVLGVRVSDNLKHADLILVVEGEDDKIALQAVLAAHSAPLKKAFAEGLLAVDFLTGAGKLNYKLTQLKAAVCDYFCFLDHDQAGMAAIEAAKQEGLLSESDYKLALRPGATETEFEDLLDPQSYAPAILKQFNVDLAPIDSINAKIKWSQKVSLLFQRAGMPWTDALSRQVKFSVAIAVDAAPAQAVRPQFVPLIQSLASALESRLA